MRRNRLVLIALLALAALPSFGKDIESFRANAAAMQAGRAFAIQIGISRWSTDAEREMLLTTLQEKGSEALLDALKKIRPTVGYFRTSNSKGWNLYYARSNAMPDGSRQVVLATDRPIGFGEAATETRSSEHAFQLIELRLDAQGKGEGKFAPAAKVSWDRSTKRLEIENYSTQPVALINVTSSR